MKGNKILKIKSPYDNSLIKEVQMNSWEEVDNMLDRAKQLFDDIDNYIPAYKRIEILEKLLVQMKDNADSLIITATQEGGKPYEDTKVELERAINGVQIAIETIANLKGEQIPMGRTKSSSNRIAFTQREPIGVVVAISAFNHPLNLIVHQVVTAFSAGCPVIIKPALTTPLSCVALLELLEKAGLPEGWCQLAICLDDVAEKLASDKRINYLSFIGSAKVGWYLRSKLADGVRCGLEHGGVAPVIVGKDADINEIIPALAKGSFYHAGQVCVSVQKIFIDNENVDEFCNNFSTYAQAMKVGDPLDPKTEIGPLILEKELERVAQWVGEAISEGAELICGGERIGDTCYQPTILLNPSESSKVSRLEIFAPVVCVYSYQDIGDAIDRANSLDTAFQSSVFTNNLNLALDVSAKLNSSAVMINDHTAFRVDWMPFGGRDSSGIGVGGIAYTINEMTREKLIVIKSKSIR